MVGAPRPAAGPGTSHRPRLGAPHRGVPSGLVGRTRMRLDAQGDAPRPLHQRRPRTPPKPHSRTGTLGPAPSTSPRRTGSPRPSAPGNPNCSPTSTPVSPTGPPKASTGSSKPSNAKASATPTPTTTASASSTAAPDTLNPPDNRTPLPHQTRRATKPAFFSERIEPGSEEPWEEGLVIMHNPRAKVPLPLSAFEGVTQIQQVGNTPSFDLRGRKIYNQRSICVPSGHG